MPTAIRPMPDQRARSYDGLGSPANPSAARRSRPRASSTRSRYGGDRIHVKKIELTRSAADAREQVFSSLTDLAGGGTIQIGTNYVPGRRNIMTRLIALLVALAFVLGAGTTPVWAQTPAKPEQKAPPAAKKQPLDINSASADELTTVAGIGEADAKKIVANRPYKSTDELVQKKVMPKATYDKIKNQIVAK